MPIDPNIANAMLNPKQFQMPDPMDGMGKALTNALMIDKLRTAQDERHNNAMLGQAWKDGGGDRTKVMKALIEKGQGANVPVLMKQFAEVDDKMAGAAKTKADTLKSKQESIRALFTPYMNSPNVTPQQMYDVMGAVLNDPDIGEWYAQMKMTPEMVKQGIDHAAQNGQLPMFARAMGMTADKALEQTYHVIQEKDKQTLVGSNKYGAPNAAVAGTYGAKPEGGTTINIDNRAADAYAKKAMEIQAEDDAALRKSAEAGPAQLDAIARARALIPRAYTGMGADAKLTVTAGLSALGQQGFDDALTASQELKMFLSENSLKNIANLWQEGVKLGAVTKPEFDQLMASVPHISSSPAVIAAWLNRAEAMTRRTIERNQMRQGQITGDPKLGGAIGNIVPPPPQVPSAPTGPIMDKDGDPIPPEAVEGLRKNRNNPVHINSFKKHFGDAAAAQVLGGTPTGGNPFPGEAGAR